MKGGIVIGRLMLLTLLGYLWHGQVALAEEVILGAVAVESHMGEPLQVKVPLIKATGQLTTHPAIKQVDALWGVPTNYSHQGGPTLAVKLQQENGDDSLVITSNQGMTIPFFTLLLKMVTEDRMIVRNLPIFLDERGNGSVASQQGVPPPVSTTSPVATSLAPMATTTHATLWKNVALGLSAAALFGLSFYSLKSKRRMERWGLARGQARKRPMAVPVAERQEPVSLDTPGDSPPVQETQTQPASDVATTQAPEPQTTQTSSKTVTKGVTITTVVRKKESSDKTPPTPT